MGFGLAATVVTGRKIERVVLRGMLQKGKRVEIVLTPAEGDLDSAEIIHRRSMTRTAQTLSVSVRRAHKLINDIPDRSVLFETPAGPWQMRAYQPLEWRAGDAEGLGHPTGHM